MTRRCALDARAAAHRFDGHKAQVAADTDSQLITAVDVLPGNAPEAEQALEVVEASEAATDCAVDQAPADCAYGAGETRAAFAARGRTLIANVPELHTQGDVAKTAFQIDLEAGTCTCPNGQTTAELRPANGGGGQFVFATELCAACPGRAQCTQGKSGRTIQVHPQEAVLQQARALQASPAFAEARRRRQVVEHRIARLVQLGIRQARYVGRTKTLFQVCLAAAVANLTLLAAASRTLTSGQVQPGSVPLVAMTTILSLMFSLVSALATVGTSAYVHRLITPAVPLIRSLQATSRPAF
jgi:hypothetical protein